MNYNKVVIPSCCICHNKVTEVELCLDNLNHTLIDGTVLDPQGNPVSNAGIEVIQVCKLSGLPKTIGCVFTDELGKYAFSLEINPQYYYTFKLYSTI